jgi:hypothetical protein
VEAYCGSIVLILGFNVMDFEGWTFVTPAQDTSPVMKPNFLVRGAHYILQGMPGPFMYRFVVQEKR